MKFPASILRFVFTLAAGLILGSSPSHAQNLSGAAHDAPAKKEAASAQPPLPPDIEKQLSDILGKIKDSRADFLNGQMKAEIDQLVQITGLKDEGAHALDAAARQAVTASLDHWTPKFPDVVRQQLASMPHEQMRSELTDAEGQLEMLTRSNVTGDAPAPDEQDAWMKALHQVLTPAQFDLWKQTLAKRKADAEAEIAGLIKSSSDRLKSALTTQVNTTCKNIEDTLNLTKDRAAKIDDLGQKVVAQAVDQSRLQEQNYLLSLSEDQRRPLVGSGFYMSPQQGQGPTELPAWSSGLAQILTADERTALRVAGDRHKAKRAHVMGEVMITLLDAKLALTDAQRRKLQPVADRLVKDIHQLYPPEGQESFYSLSPQLFFTAAATVADSELNPILDSTQLERWHELSQADHETDEDADKVPLVAGTEPEDVERLVSTFFYEKTENERKAALETSTLKAEDVVRVTGLSGASAERLQAAARGATEQYLATWKWFTEQQVRSQLQDLTPQNVQQRLESVQGFFYQRRFGLVSQDDIWDKTLQTELSPQEQDAWQKECTAREVFHRNAIADLALSELDRRANLTDAQWTKLQPMVVGVLTDYSQGIAQVFSGMNGVPWYLNGPYMLIPFAGVDDTDLRSILGKDQMDAWTQSQAFANANNLWQVIKQMRGRRAAQNGGIFIQD